MYERHYALTANPFSILPDPRFLYLRGRHGMAYAMLEYGVTNRAAFSVICGEIGCGKTTLIRHLLNNVGRELTVGLLSNIQQNLADPLEWVMLAFGQRYDGLSQVGLYHAFQNYLIAEYSAGRRMLLIVDEAQNLSSGALESLRMLSNVNVDEDQLLQIVLVGQPQLREMMRRPEMRQLTQRVSAHFFIAPLEEGEVEPYIRHRLKVAGRSAPLFTSAACRRIAKASEGIPRTINILCDTALVYGFSASRPEVNEHLIDEVLEDRCEFGI